MTHFDLFKYMDQDPEKLRGRVKDNNIELIKKYRILIKGEYPTVTHIGYNIEGYLKSGIRRDIFMIEFNNGFKFPTLNNLGSTKFPAYVSSGTNFSASQRGKLSIYAGHSLKFSNLINKRVQSLLNSRKYSYLNDLLDYFCTKFNSPGRSPTRINKDASKLRLLTPWFIKLSSSIKKQDTLSDYSTQGYNLKLPNYINKENEEDVFRFLGGHNFVENCMESEIGGGKSNLLKKK